MTLPDQERSDDERKYYLSLMDNKGVLHQKVSDIAGLVRPGTVVDHGCSSGQLLKSLHNIYPESTCIGVDRSAEMLDIAHNNTGFDLQLVHSDIRDAVLSGVDTIIASSVVHELWSAELPGQIQALEGIKAYFHNAYEQLSDGGHFVIRGLGGINNPDEIIRARLAVDDGIETPLDETPARYLSTFRRALQFEKQFLPQCNRGPNFEVLNDGYIEGTRRDIWEYILTKDYTNAWDAEMYEEFCGLSRERIVELLRNAGFEVGFVRSYVSPWIENNRLKGEVTLIDQSGDPLPYSPTNYVIRARKTG